MNKKTLRNCQGKQSQFDYQAKLILIGDSGVGKTNILTRFCQDVFKDCHVATIGVDFSIRIVQIQDKRIRLQVWDTAGQERFRTITETYYKGATGIVMVYAVDCRESFLSMQKWINQINARTNSEVKKLLIANKVDIEPSKRQVSQQQGLQLAQKHGLNYMEVSAKTNINIEQIFFTLAKMIKSQLEIQCHNQFDGLSRTITLNPSFQSGLNRKNGKAKGDSEDDGKSRKKCLC